MSTGEQVAILWIVSKGLLDDVHVENTGLAEQAVLEKIKRTMHELDRMVEKATKEDPIWENFISQANEELGVFIEDHADTGITEQEDKDRP